MSLSKSLFKKHLHECKYRLTRRCKPLATLKNKKVGLDSVCVVWIKKIQADETKIMMGRESMEEERSSS